MQTPLKLKAKGRLLSLLSAIVMAPVGLFAQSAPVEVQNVTFRGIANDWVQVEVQLLAGENTAEGARDRNFIQNVGVELLLAYERQGGDGSFDYYASEVEIVAMERGDRPNVYFFMAGPIVKRDRLPRGEPFAYLVNLTVNGADVPMGSRAVSSRIRGNEAGINSLRQNARSESGLNEGILMPSYFAPLGDIRAQVRGEPIYQRRDGR
jgi:hypothetical protein